ncbi:hypothetical protein ALC56_12471 [Trachymyrmex septentrionalis]|uniref:RRM domain-containing protein n=1 Tax=Trachymyrmex septentrionalis TaxID=34720 RepID=A0A195EY38_9HYME|nr:hypothetical protein ALC56_12471 [Trachymyrmex septentrionalis]
MSRRVEWLRSLGRTVVLPAFAGVTELITETTMSFLHHAIQERLYWYYDNVMEIGHARCKWRNSMNLPQLGGDTYAFVEFENHITASAALTTLNQRLFLEKSRRLLRSGRAGNWRLLLLLLADPILSWYIVVCYSHLHTYRVIINIPTPYSRVSSSSSPSGAEAARELSDCSAYPLLRLSPLLSPPLRFGTFPGLDGRSGSEQAFFMDIIAAAILPYVKHIRRDCTAHRLKYIHDDISNGSNGNCFRTRNGALRALSLGIV